VAGKLNAGVWRLELGGDVMDADHDASRTVLRRDTGMLMRQDLIWGGARIQTLGAFARGERPVGATTLGLALRIDQVKADADTVSPFFATQYGTDVEDSELNWSGAATWRVPVAERWTATLGVGSVVRTAEANERFSDRAASKRAQTNAEFLGDPTLRPERSTQADIWLEGRVGRAVLQLNGFARQMDDYITIVATALPTAQPASPPPVYRYVNGEARYFGGEAQIIVAATQELTFGASSSYLYGQDITMDEPALGVTPLRSTLLTRFAPMGAPWFAEAQMTVAGEQRRVATTRGERVTPGWTTVDIQGGYRPRSAALRNLELRAGVRNLLDRPVVQHLSANNAFGGGRLYEPGRVLFVRLSVGEL
jgi:iron complex outermembrane receptor protein